MREDLKQQLLQGQAVDIWLFIARNNNGIRMLRQNGLRPVDNMIRVFNFWDVSDLLLALEFTDLQSELQHLAENEDWFNRLANERYEACLVACNADQFNANDSALASDSECNNLSHCLRLEEEYFGLFNIFYNSDIEWANSLPGEEGARMSVEVSDWYQARYDCGEFVRNSCILDLDWNIFDFEEDIENCVQRQNPEKAGFKFTYGNLS